MAARRMEPGERRRQLIEAAAEIFSRQGFANARVSEIAARADVAKGTVYEYFASKEELFLAVFEWHHEQAGARVREEIDRAGAARAKLRALLTTGARIIAEQPELYSLSFDFWAASQTEELRRRFEATCSAMYEEFRQGVVDLLAEGRERGEVRSGIDDRAVASAVVGALDGLGYQHFIDRSVNPVEVAEAFLAAVCDGICEEGS